VTLQPEAVLITLAAVVPPALAAALVVRMCPPAERSRLATAVAFLWGAAVAATIASPLNDVAGTLLAGHPAEATSRWIVPALAAPAIEELAKASGFAVVGLLAPAVMTGMAGAVATGALLGLGFAATENVGYYTLAAVQGGAAGLARAVYLRGVVEAANHALFTATTGAGIGWAATRARSKRARLVAIGVALAIAVALHGVWNGLVSDAITRRLCAAPTPDAACAPAPDAITLVVVVPALEAAFVAPVVVALAWLVRRAR
jgi:RsiW-degrading membrane proteinase PrsW (M82 family)